MTLTEIRKDKTYAHVAPFAAFMLLNFLLMIIDETGLKWDHPDAPWWRMTEHWFYPLQTIICGATLIFFWRHYDIKWDKRIIIGAIMGAIGIGFWILPTHLYSTLDYTEDTVGWLKYLGLDARADGFNPNDMQHPAAVWFTTIFRFLRAAVIVAFVEEVFWRGFLMRFLLKPDGNYWKIPFGKFSWFSFAVVTTAFVFIHQPVDYAGAVVFGILMYIVAVKTKSLAACIVMHAVANLLMGIYALQYAKYGLW